MRYTRFIAGSFAAAGLSTAAFADAEHVLLVHGAAVDGAG